MTTLNQGQQDAASKIFNFLISNQKEMNLSGPAGVGKTFMLKYVMDHILDEYKHACTLMGQEEVINDICLCATTNKAAEVLTKATGQDAVTVHSALGLTVKNDFRTGETYLQTTSAWRVHSRTIFIIDEASMIDKDLHKYLMDGTDNTCKILYVSDHCQLAPVKQKLSTIYNQHNPLVQLTQQMRNSGNPDLMRICQQARDIVLNQQFSTIPHTIGAVEYFDGPSIKAFIDTQMYHPEHNARIMSYTNARVDAYNQYIRELRGLGNKPAIGEKMVAVNTVNQKTASLRVEQELTIASVSDNAVSVRISNTREDTIPCWEVSFQAIGGRFHVPVDKKYYKDLIRHYARQKNWPAYFFLKEKIADIRQFDATTVYKAQGSTYDIAILDLEDLGTCNQADQVARMLYVGISRARERVILVRDLPSKYKG